MKSLQISYVSNLKFFKILGLVPNQISAPRMALSRVYATTIISFLFFYWAVLLLSFWLPHGKTSNQISVISNWIQLMFNAITLSITLSYPIIAAQIVPRIRDLFNHFDKKVMEMGVDSNFKQMTRTIGFVVGSVILFNSYMLCYDLYVTYFLKAVSDLWYWLLTFLPLFLYSFGICSALCVLLLLHFRFKTLNFLLLREVKANRSACDMVPVIDVLMASCKKEDKPLRPGHKLTKIFYLMHDLYDLSKLIGQYYGPMFLTVFTAIFVVTTIQIYYIYTFFYNFATRGDQIIWSIILCANVVFLNIVMAFAITSICESISNQSKLAVDTISKLKISGTNSCEPEEVQKIARGFNCTTTCVTFSANGFFNINYSMLCSMIGGITTYLIIYIQFYALYGKEGETSDGPQRDDSQIKEIVSPAKANDPALGTVSRIRT